MAAIDDWLDLMPLTVVVEPFVTRDQAGVATYGTAVSYRARVNNKAHNVIGPDGQMVLASGTVWLATTSSIGVDDRVTLPDGTIPRILASNGEYDETTTQLYSRLDLA